MAGLGRVEPTLRGMAATNWTTTPSKPRQRLKEVWKTLGKGPHVCTDAETDVFAVNSAFASRLTVSSLQRSTKMKKDGAKPPRKMCKRHLGF